MFIAPHAQRSARQRIDLGARRGPSLSATGFDPTIWPDSADLVELDLGEDLRLYTRGGELDTQLSAQTDRTGTLSWVLQASGGLFRDGTAGLPVRGLSILDIDLEAWLGPVAGLATEAIAHKVCAWIDGRAVQGRGGGVGLYGANAHSPYAQPGSAFRAGQRGLLLVHGFLSHGAGSFGGFWEPAGRGTFDQLRRHYDGAVGVLDHATLGAGPVRNALDLVANLEEGLELDLLSFSRGGLVAELLSRAQAEDGFRESELQRLERIHGWDATELRQLHAEVRRKALRFPHLVRVAGPLRGTWLASNRLDRWLSVLWNVARRVLPGGIRQLADVLFDLIAAVVKARLDRNHFPGIEAMRPDGPLAALLNDRPPTLAQRLTVVAGDCEGGGLGRRLLLLLADGFFGEPHDLVVPTASMFGGAPRADGTRYLFHRAAAVSHFQYFHQPDSLRVLSLGLTADAGRLATLPWLPASGEPVDPDALIATRAARRPIPADAPLVVVLPGIMGSSLARLDDRRLWMDFGEIAFGNFADLALSAASHGAPYPPRGGPDIYPWQPLDYWPVNFYGRLLSRLAKEDQLVLPFAYDWRKPIAIAADALAAELRLRWPAGSARPLRFVAHSMGGLVVRVLLHRHPELRRRFAAGTGNRLLMLGTPNRGSHAITRTLLKQNPLIDKLACLAPQEEHELLTVAATFPGFLELLPSGERDWWVDGTWQTLFGQHGVPVPERPRLSVDALRRAQSGHQELEQALPALPLERCCYVAGFVPEDDADATIVALDGNGQFVPGPGDGTVSYASGVLEAERTWYVATAHGDLPAERKHFDGYLELLARGTTTLFKRRWQDLPQSQKNRSRLNLPAQAQPLRPTRAEVLRALLGAREPATTTLEARTDLIQLRVVHGGLKFARHPLLLGHYQGDTLRGSESELDWLYEGQLRRSLDLGVYPGAVGSAQVFSRTRLTADRRSAEAIIVGLGRPGELTAGELRRSVRSGILAWFGARRRGLGEDGRQAGFSTVLLGSTLSGMSVSECARCLLQGVLDAQAQLRTLPVMEDAVTRIVEIELLELYEFRALELARALARLIADEFADRLTAPERLEQRDDGSRRLPTEPGGQIPQRLDIRAYGSGRLQFALPGIQAAVPLLRRQFDPREIEHYARAIDRDHRTDPALGRVLFQQLLPAELKVHALEQHKLVLTLNRNAASLPWEMVDAGGDCPLAVQSGMVRQLRSTRYRPRERVSEDTALVIGDPTRDLPGARREARFVAELLTSLGCTVVYLDQPDALTLREALSRQPYKIVHLAAHGELDYHAPGTSETAGAGKSGMVIGTLPGADGLPHALLLTAEDIAQSFLTAPELVFINCCHLGAQSGTGRSLPGLASHFGNAFMDLGCRAVIAAGWAVDDESATVFAEAFYQSSLSERQPYIDAVREARRTAWAQSLQQSNTWGAYQCYGDPAWLPHRPVAQPAGPVRLLTIGELEIWLSDLRREAMGADAERITQLTERLHQQLSDPATRQLVRSAPQLTLVVEVHEALGAYGQARQWLADWLARHKAMSPTLWRARARLALRAEDLDAATAALLQVRRLQEIEQSAYGWLELGTYGRRVAELHWQRGDGPATRAALEQLITDTLQALELQTDGELSRLPELHPAWTYKALSALVVAEHLGWPRAKAAHARFQAARTALLAHFAARKNEQSPGRNAAREFWDDIDDADLRLVLLARPQSTRNLQEATRELAEIAQHYLVAMAVSGTPAQRDSIVSHVRFWVALCDFLLSRTPRPEPGRKRHWTWLRDQLRSALLTTLNGADARDDSGPPIPAAPPVQTVPASPVPPKPQRRPASRNGEPAPGRARNRRRPERG